jgi:hypothetical protein
MSQFPFCGLSREHLGELVVRCEPATQCSPQVGTARSAAGAAPPLQLETGLDGRRAQLCFHVQAGNYNTETLIEVLDELRCFLGGQKATKLRLHELEGRPHGRDLD